MRSFQKLSIFYDSLVGLNSFSLVFEKMKVKNFLEIVYFSLLIHLLPAPFFNQGFIIIFYCYSSCDTFLTKLL